MSPRSYRPDIDGLRAIAVLVVVFFHAPLGFRGGYIGVDVFFVISGFLITSLIMSDLERGRFSFLEFWERRVRRIFPALCLMVVATLVAGWFLLLPSDYAALGKSAVAQGLLISNVHFWQTSGYFATAAEDRPLLHTWSLAVEEQFYLMLPLLLFFAFRARLVRRSLITSGCLAIVCLVGLVVAQYGVVRHPDAAFYLMPFRAWELLCGATIALLPVTVALSRPVFREMLAILGLSAILIPAWFYKPDTPFPGIAAVPPCLGTALLIWLNRSPIDSSSQHSTLVARLLSHRALVFVGLISYSLYLWHWPVLVLAKYWALHPYSRAPRIGLILLSFVLAILSWKYVELPFRNRQSFLTRARIFSLAGILTASIIACGLLIQSANGVPDRFPERLLAVLPQITPQNESNDGWERNPRFMHQNFGFKWFTREPADGRAPDILVWGDSHAEKAVPAFESLCKDCGRSGIAAIRYATAPVIDESFNDLNTEPIAAGAATSVIDYVERNKVKDTFLIAYWELYQKHCGKDHLKNALRDTIDTLSQTGTRIWIMVDNPCYDVSVPRVLARNILFSMDDVTWKLKVADHRSRNAAIYELASETSAAKIIDPSFYLQEDNSDFFRVTEHGVTLYSDSQHLSTEGAIVAILPSLRHDFLSRVDGR